MTDELKKTPPPISSSDLRRTTGRYGAREEPKTVETPVIPGPLAAVLAEIQESVREGFTRVNANIDATHVAVDGLQDRVQRLEDAAKNRTGPQKTYSGQIKGLADEVGKVTGNDHTQDAAIADIKVKVDALTASQAKQTENIVDIKGAVSGFFRQHPELTSGAATLLGVIITLLTAWFQSKVHP